MLIRRAGAGFMALANYITPLWAVGLGALIFHERLDWPVFLALGVILAGVAISQRSPFGKKRGARAVASELAPVAEKTSDQTDVK